VSSWICFILFKGREKERRREERRREERKREGASEQPDEDSVFRAFVVWQLLSPASYINFIVLTSITFNRV